MSWYVKTYKSVKLFFKKFLINKLKLKREKAGFVILMTCLIIPVALYCIMMAVNYTQIYSVHLKMRRALLQAAFEVSKNINPANSYKEGSTHYNQMLLLAETAFINALGARLSGISNEYLAVNSYTLKTSDRENLYQSVNDSGAKILNMEQLGFVAISSLARYLKLKNSHDFEIKSCTCEKGNNSLNIYDIDKWTFPLYPASESTGFKDEAYLNDRWEVARAYKHAVNWNCNIEVIIPGDGSLSLSQPGLMLRSKRIMVNKKRYPRDISIPLGYGSSTKLGYFKLQIVRSDGRITIRTSCPYTFLKTDLAGSSLEKVNIGRTLSIPTSINSKVDLALAVPLHRVNKLKTAISKFIKRFDTNGMQIALIPYSGSVVAPGSFSSNNWLAVYKPKFYKTKEMEVRDSYSIRFEIHNTLIGQCLREYTYAKKISDYNGCSDEEKEVCSKHLQMEEEFLYYPSIKHYFMYTRGNYGVGTKKITNTALLREGFSNNAELTGIFVSNAGTGWRTIKDLSYLVAANVEVNGRPLAIAHTPMFCSVCGSPKFSNSSCGNCGSGSSKIMPSFYSYGNLGHISSKEFFILDSVFNDVNISFQTMTAGIDDLSPTGCKFLKTNDAKRIALRHIYLTVDASGIHVLATENPMEQLMSKAMLLQSVNFNQNTFNIYLVNGISISPTSQFINSRHYLAWHLNTFDSVGFSAPLESTSITDITNALKGSGGLQRLCENASIVVYDGCDCKEEEVVKEIRCLNVPPYTCVNKDLSLSEVSSDTYQDLAYSTPKHVVVTGGCPTEDAFINKKELASACLNGYLQHEVFYNLMDDFGIDKKELKIDDVTSSMDGMLKITINKVSNAVTPESLINKVCNTLNISETSFKIYNNGTLKSGDSNAKNAVYLTVIRDGEPTNMLYPALSVRDLYHSSAKDISTSRDSKLFTEQIPNTTKIMYPTTDTTDMTYNEMLDTEIIGPPRFVFWQLNNKPCLGAFGNLTNVGGWKNLQNDAEYRTGGLFCRTVPSQLDTHAYEMRFLSGDVMDLAFYVLMLSDTYEKSNFQYLGLVWAARALNYNNRAMYAGSKDMVRPDSVSKKVLIFIATSPNAFADNELTSLGFLNDNGDAVLNNSSYNLTIGENNKPEEVLDKRTAMVIENIKNEMPDCDLYAISYNVNQENTNVESISPSIKNLAGNKFSSVLSEDQFDAVLTKIADDVLAESGRIISIVE